ncbi:MAG: hypothetical protein FJ265_17515, partial [Planctomycetes bacterium]|nr:hypothetical protein [Planctomycetota bacterium]
AALGFRGAPPQGPRGRAAARELVGMQHVELDAAAQTVRLPRPGMALDLGAIGKGHALDLAAQALREHGVRRALLHAGTSSVLALGAPPGLPGFRIGVGPWQPGPVATLREAALSVSRPHGQQQPQPDGTSAAHVVDPRTCAPVAGGPALAAVIAASARTSDALSTALLVDPTLPPPAGGAALHARAEHGTGPGTWTCRGEAAACFHLPEPVSCVPPP